MSKANELRAALKAAGWSTKQVTVRADACSLNVTIRDAKIPTEVVKNVAKAFERVRYCERSGEILQGGNTFVSVGHADGLLDGLEAEILAHLRTGAQDCRGFTVVAGTNNHDDGFTVYGDWPSRTFTTWTLEAAAEELAGRTAGWVQWDVACTGEDETTWTTRVWAPTEAWATDSAKHASNKTVASASTAKAAA